MRVLYAAVVGWNVRTRCSGLLGTMNESELFQGRYEEEARERWGDTDAYRESRRRAEGCSKEDWARLKAEGDAILDELAAKKRDGAKPEDEEVVDLAERHRLHIDRWFYPCGAEMHRGLAEMYVTDERFTDSLDAHGEGLARFLAEAIRANAARG